MSFSVLNNIVSPDSSDTGFNSVGFRILLKAHKTHLLGKSDTVTIEMTGVEATRYTGDLGRWCIEKGYGENYHWCIAMLNGYSSPDSYDGNRKTIYVPSLTYINELLQRYNSTLK